MGRRSFNLCTNAIEWHRSLLYFADVLLVSGCLTTLQSISLIRMYYEESSPSGRNIFQYRGLVFYFFFFIFLYWFWFSVVRFLTDIFSWCRGCLTPKLMSKLCMASFSVSTLGLMWQPVFPFPFLSFEENCELSNLTVFQRKSRRSCCLEVAPASMTNRNFYFHIFSSF